MADEPNGNAVNPLPTQGGVMANNLTSLSQGPLGQPIGSPAPNQGEHQGAQEGRLTDDGKPWGGVPPADTPADSPANKPDKPQPTELPGTVVEPAGYPEDVRVAPAPEETDGSKPSQSAGTDKNYDDPADANEADIEAATAGPWEAAPQPFRKRDTFPDLTSESVNIRLDEDYWPADPGRHQNGNQPRGYKGQLLAFPSDEAIALIQAGIGHREDEYAEERADEQRQRWAARDEERKRLEAENNDGA